MSLGRKIKAAQKKKWIELQKRIKEIVSQHEDYKRRNDIGEKKSEYLYSGILPFVKLNVRELAFVNVIRNLFDW